MRAGSSNEHPARLGSAPGVSGAPGPAGSPHLPDRWPSGNTETVDRFRAPSSCSRSAQMDPSETYAAVNSSPRSGRSHMHQAPKVAPQRRAYAGRRHPERLPELVALASSRSSQPSYGVSPDINGPEDRLCLANARASVPWRPVIQKILDHLGLDPQPPPKGRAREPGQPGPHNSA